MTLSILGRLFPAVGAGARLHWYRGLRQGGPQRARQGVAGLASNAGQ